MLPELFRQMELLEISVEEVEKQWNKYRNAALS